MNATRQVVLNGQETQEKMAGGSFLKPNRTPTHIFKNNLNQYNENASSIYQYSTSTANMLTKSK